MFFFTCVVIFYALVLYFVNRLLDRKSDKSMQILNQKHLREIQPLRNRIAELEDLLADTQETHILALAAEGQTKKLEQENSALRKQLERLSRRPDPKAVQQEIQSLHNRIAELEDILADTQRKRSSTLAAEDQAKKLEQENAALRKQVERLSQRPDPKAVRQEIDSRAADIVRQRAKEVLRGDLYRKSLLAFDISSRLPVDANARMLRALKEKPEIIPPLHVTASIRGKTDTYTTTLDSCTCKDFQFNREPCKHMYHLALVLGLLGDTRG